MEHISLVLELVNNMKIKIDDKIILDLTDTMRKVICNDIKSEEFDEDIERRIKMIIMEKYDACYKRLKEKWDKELEQRGYEFIPTDRNKYAELVFSQPDYKSRSEREKHGN